MSESYQNSVRRKFPLHEGFRELIFTEIKEGDTVFDRRSDEKHVVKRVENFGNENQIFVQGETLSFATGQHFVWFVATK